MNFAKVLKRGKEGLVERLHKALSITEPERSLKRLHASDVCKSGTMSEFCSRERAILQTVSIKPYDQSIGTAMNVTFQIGRFLENQTRNEWLKDIIFGDWECVSCKKVVYMKKCPDKCKICANSKFNYLETRITGEKSLISCGIDAMLDIPGKSKFIILELKSIDKDEFLKLKKPKKEHLERTNMYMRIMEESEYLMKDLVHTDIAKILYISKGFGYKRPDLSAIKGCINSQYTPFKEFNIIRDDKLTDKYYQKGIEFAKWSKTMNLPKRICNTSNCKRAKRCKVQTNCFGWE